ncbi:thermonuclease family protein [Brucella tritici]|uniref:thermonuclease family protein n=1 Tax=Brucella tritici TaxID=94626 RepID=UPI001F349E6B|nr:thermonuclease family protein [Brucella tritici]
MLGLILAVSVMGWQPPADQTPRQVIPISGKCRGCGCKGGPGWRVHSTGQCASYRNLAQNCGSPPSEDRCTYELGGLKQRGTVPASSLFSPPVPKTEAKPSKSNGSIAGRASVIDADTIEIHGQRIRIWGIDAPEGAQTCADVSGKEYRCGQIGSMKLASYLDEAQPIICAQRDVDKYSRIVASCVNTFGQDLATWLVRNGHALDWPMYSKGAYSSAQKDAQSRKAGIWQGTFVEPWEWRKLSKGAM